MARSYNPPPQTKKAPTTGCAKSPPEELLWSQQGGCVLGGGAQLGVCVGGPPGSKQKKNFLGRQEYKDVLAIFTTSPQLAVTISNLSAVR